MAAEEAVHRRTFPSGGDLSAQQYRWMKLNNAGKVVVATGGTDAIGTLQNKPAAEDREAAVWVGGSVKAICGGAISAGDKVTCDANGATVVSSSGDNVILGFATEAGVANQVIAVEVDKRG